MQKVTGEALREKARKLLSSGEVSAVLGWKKGEFDYDVTPAVFDSVDALSEFVWGDFCGANLSKYLIKETKKQRVLVFLKPCDTFSFNQLLTEHRFNRENIYAVGVPCSGMADVNLIRQKVGEGIVSVENTGEALQIETLYSDEPVRIDRREVLSERCRNCKSKKHAAYDELLGDAGEDMESDRFQDVEKLESMTADERFTFWQNELSRCIRCNACRDVCPACTCETCVFNNPASGAENKAPVNSFEEQMFHIIRAFHVAGRCTDCGECSRVCPEHIPLHLINRKIIKDMNTFYGEYQAGAEVGAKSPLLDFALSDIEPGAVFDGRDHDA